MFCILFLSYFIVTDCCERDLIKFCESTLDELPINIETEALLNTFESFCELGKSFLDFKSFDNLDQSMDIVGYGVDIKKNTDHNTTLVFDKFKKHIILTDENKISKNSLEINKLDEYINELYECIKNYIKNNLNSTFSSPYITRLDIIKKVLYAVSEQKSDTENIFSPEIDKTIEELFNDYLKKYFFNLILDYNVYDLFSKDFDEMIKKLEKNKNLKKLYKNITTTPDLHLREFMKIYKYVNFFPELLTLGYLLNNEQYKKIHIQLHLISLFLTKNENDFISKRIFIMFLIGKINRYSFNLNLDLVSLLKYQELIYDDKSKLFFFCWEFPSFLRNKISNRIKYYKDHSFYFYENDRIYYNVVLRLFVFQHVLYLKYKNVSDIELEEFKVFTKSIFEEKNGCYRSQFNRFMNKMQLN